MLFDWHPSIDMPVTIEMPFILRRKKRAVRMMATVVMLFVACWAPFHLVSLLLDYGTKPLVLFPLAYSCQSPSFFFFPSQVMKKTTTFYTFVCQPDAVLPVRVNTFSLQILSSFCSSLTFRRGQHLVPVNLRQAIICSFIPLTVITMATIINLV